MYFAEILYVDTTRYALIQAHNILHMKSLLQRFFMQIKVRIGDFLLKPVLEGEERESTQLHAGAGKRERFWGPQT